jgi:hypothetical protein
MATIDREITLYKTKLLHVHQWYLHQEETLTTAANISLTTHAHHRMLTESMRNKAHELLGIYV